MAAKGKSNNPPLGVIECDGCGGFATIRRRSNGRRLLYTHCVNCGMNQMSGAKLQAKWEKAIGQNMGENSAIESEISQPLNAPQIPSEIKADEWQPPEVIQAIQSVNNEIKESETNERNNTNSTEKNISGTGDGRASNGFGFFIFGAITGLAAIAGIRAS
ncbi:hypothetical protein [Idiomarina abyssalis]|uniref:hypothetical protein n=1 Tax=Idiomarina abyssalis TaxID=86102 RepID=UPI003A8C8D62